MPNAAEEVYDITDATDYGLASQNISSTNQLGWVSPAYNGLTVSVGYTALDAAADSSWTLEYDASSLMDGLAVGYETEEYGFTVAYSDKDTATYYGIVAFYSPEDFPTTFSGGFETGNPTIFV